MLAKRRLRDALAAAEAKQREASKVGNDSSLTAVTANIGGRRVVDRAKAEVAEPISRQQEDVAVAAGGQRHGQGAPLQLCMGV